MSKWNLAFQKALMSIWYLIFTWFVIPEHCLPIVWLIFIPLFFNQLFHLFQNLTTGLLKWFQVPSIDIFVNLISGCQSKPFFPSKGRKVLRFGLHLSNSEHGKFETEKTEKNFRSPGRPSASLQADLESDRNFEAETGRSTFLLITFSIVIIISKFIFISRK